MLWLPSSAGSRWTDLAGRPHCWHWPLSRAITARRIRCHLAVSLPWSACFLCLAWSAARWCVGQRVPVVGVPQVRQGRSISSYGLMSTFPLLPRVVGGLVMQGRTSSPICGRDLSCSVVCPLFECPDAALDSRVAAALSDSTVDKKVLP